MDDDPRLTSNCPLDYAPAPRWRRRRRPWQRGIGILFLIAIGFAIWHLGPAAWNTARMLYWQRQALTYTAPPDQVVYEEEPQSAKTLLAGSGGYAPFTPGYSITAAAVHVPSCVGKLSGVILPASPITGATLFLHEMKTPDGRPHLVLVQC